jgi:hypothetical protein
MEMHIEPLSLRHQAVLEDRFDQIDHPLSEFSFANLFLFRKVHHYEVIQNEKDLFIKGKTRDGVTFIMLTSPPQCYKIEGIRNALQEAEILFPVPDEWLPHFKMYMTDATYLNEDSDYLFTVTKLALYPGRHLSKKRNLVKQLQTNYTIESKPLLMKHTNEAIQVLNCCREEQKGNNDYESCMEAIQNLHTLKLQGRMVYLNGKPAGFTIGEKISTDSYAVHFCKGSHNIKGLHQYLYQSLAQSLMNSCSWINIEQDLGIPSFRAAKHSYQPDRYIRKWRLNISCKIQIDR